MFTNTRTSDVRLNFARMPLPDTYTDCVTCGLAFVAGKITHNDNTTAGTRHQQQ
ncbi:hypothetical protein C8J34_104150 [Rhizobium sp. PP-F2F-G36]|nr:hypothetical protein C8J34_104150 [Rhizobium sp. PP-F2F-G36]